MTDWDRVKHFTRGEFGRNADVEPCPMLVEMLDRAREVAGVPFVITSGIRSPERNADVGGSADSSHLTGYAVDVHCPRSRHRFLMMQALLEVGFRRIGIGDTFIHADTDPNEAQDVIWTY